jgi:hypothetical protein
MRSAKDAKRKAERDSRRRLGLQLSLLPGVAVAAERGVRLVGLAADEDPELGLLGVVGLRQVAQVCEEHQVRQARAEGWTWAQIATALEVTPQAVHQRHAPRMAAGPPRTRLSRRWSL